MSGAGDLGRPLGFLQRFARRSGQIMKAPAVVAAAVVVGCGLGLFVAGARLGFTASSDVVSGDVARPEQASTTAQPKVRVDSEQHDFGVVEVDSLSSHAFKFTNEGDSPLLLTAGSTSCG